MGYFRSLKVITKLPTIFLSVSVSDLESLLLDLPLCARSSLTECRTNIIFILCRNFSHYTFPALSLVMLVLPFILQLWEFSRSSKETSWYFTYVPLLKLLSVSTMQLSLWGCSFWTTNTRKTRFPSFLFPDYFVYIYYCTYHEKVLSVCQSAILASQ